MQESRIPSERRHNGPTVSEINNHCIPSDFDPYGA